MQKKSIAVFSVALLTMLTVSGCSFHSVETYIEPTEISITKANNFQYDNFTTAAFESLKGSEPFAVFIHSKNCGTCAKKNKQIMTQANELTGKILKLEYTAAPTELLETVGSTKYNTFVFFDKDGNKTVQRGASFSDVKNFLNTTKQNINVMKELNKTNLVAQKVETNTNKQTVKLTETVQSNTEKNTKTTANPNVIAQANNFTYQNFTDAEFNRLKGTESFAVFFHNKSCGSCAKKHKQIMADVDTFKNGTILKLEFSDAPSALKKELNVASYDTFVVFNNQGTPTVLRGATVAEVQELL